jgi:hypothetical protein
VSGDPIRPFSLPGLPGREQKKEIAKKPTRQLEDPGGDGQSFRDIFRHYAMNTSKNAMLLKGLHWQRNWEFWQKAKVQWKAQAAWLAFLTRKGPARKDSAAAFAKLGSIL